MSTSPRIACIRIPASPTAGPAPTEVRRAALAGALLVAAPRVVPVRGHPLAFWADAAGMERLGGDDALARALVAAASTVDEAKVRVGIASSCVAAALATRNGPGPYRIVPPGADGRFLARRPLHHLPLPKDLAAALALLGLERCGDLAALDPADVELRFGAAGLSAWRLARGDDPRWPFRPAPPDAARAEAEFEPPIEQTEPLRFVLGGLVSSVSAALERRQRIPAALRLVLYLDTRETETRPVRPARPTADARVLGDLCRRALEERPLPAPLAGIALEVADESAPRADQLDAFRAPAPDPAALHAGLLPVLARWGDGALSRAVRQGAHLPGEHARWEALGAEGIGRFAVPHPHESAQREDPSVADLPLCLRRLAAPLAAQVRVDAAGRPAGLELQAAPPVEVRLGREGFPPRMWKTRAEGPERVSGCWWGAASAREYWRVESEDGCLALVYRDAATGGWFVEGWYD